jgi:hypothetical protein
MSIANLVIRVSSLAKAIVVLARQVGELADRVKSLETGRKAH